MSKLDGTLKAIQAAISKLENGTLNMEELESLVNDTRDLYERAVVIRHKAYEENVFGPREEILTTVPSPEPIHTPEIPVYSPVPDTEIEEPFREEDLIKDESQDDAPSFDFSLFDDNAEDVKEEVIEENTVEHISVTTVESENFGVHEEKTILEQVSVTPSVGENVKFVQVFSKTDATLASQIAMTRLSSLIGSFGLNERLQFINELFDGSSEAFSEAIKVLDALGGLDEALAKASVFANQYNWELESETVEEFVVKIKRRYA
ncbi:MAG: hypothetical protein ACK47F_04865 [Flavobacteriales bacterium]